MKERPILFSAPMVRAILAGTKTQTRRVVKPQPSTGWEFEAPPVFGRITSPHPKQGRFGVFIRKGVGTDFPQIDLIPCPFGKPGDRLWVRENFYQDGQWSLRLGREPDDPRGGFWSATSRVIYAADGTPLPDPIPGNQWRSRPSIHMPRWASRITLEITDVRVERLQDISGMDAKREGVSVPAHTPEDGADLDYARRGFRRLWEEIHGGGSWEKNPWVWAIEFKRLEQA